MRKTKGSARRPRGVPSALVVKGFNAEDIAAMEVELAHRVAAAPEGMTMPRNTLVVALVREALAASLRARGGDGTITSG